MSVGDRRRQLASPRSPPAPRPAVSARSARSVRSLSLAPCRALRGGPAVAAACGVLAACGGPSAEPSLFPLEPGHRWLYEVRSDWDDGRLEREQREIRTAGEARVGDRPAWRRRSSDGVEWYLRADDSGVYRVAAKSDLDAEPRPDPQPRYVLKAPLREGTTWLSTTTAYLLRRRADFPPEIRHTHPAVTMHYTIESMDAAVRTRAGAFEHCVQVRGQAVLKLFADPVAGWRDMPLVTTEWYCRGPGLVKLVREERALSSFLLGGTMTLELLTWQ